MYAAQRQAPLGQTDASYVERPGLRARTLARRCPSRYSGWRDGRIQPLAPVLLAALLILGVVTYIAIRWRRAPSALRAMSKVAGVCFIAGFLAGAWALHTAGLRLTSGAAPSGSSPSTSSATGSVPASEVGKAIVETDEKHAGDESRIPSASMAGLCNEGMPDTMSEACRVTYLARHALGKDLDRGPHESSVPLSDVADFCDSGAIDKSFVLCKQAYLARTAAMK